MSMRELINAARWDAYRDRRHNGQRLLAFKRDAAKAVKSFEWYARTRGGMTMVTLKVPGLDRIDGCDHRDMGWSGTYEAVTRAVERLTLEALRDVARATKDRLDR